MILRRLVVISIVVVSLLVAHASAQEPQPSATPIAAENKELIAAALKLTKEAAEKYEFVLEGSENQPLKFVAEPCCAGQIHPWARCTATCSYGLRGAGRLWLARSSSGFRRTRTCPTSFSRWPSGRSVANSTASQSGFLANRACVCSVSRAHRHRRLERRSDCCKCGSWPATAP